MHVTLLSRQLENRGYRPIVFCDPASRLCKDATERGLTVHPFKPAGYVAPLSIIKTAAAFKKYNVSLVHVHYSKDLWTTIPAAGKRPTVFIKHIGTQKPKTDPIHRAIYKNVDHVIAISEVIRKNLIETHPVDSEKVSVVHHGVSPADYDLPELERRKIRASLGCTENDILIGTIGRLQVGKGHLEFIGMAAKLLLKYENVRFVVVGEPTAGEEDKARIIYRRARELELDDRFQFLGFRKDIPKILKAMDIFAFPSHAEAFGLVVIEAMAARLPVVSSRCDGILDIVVDGRTGFLVEPKNTDQLTAAVEKLILDRELRLQLGENGYNRINQFFTVEKMVDDIETIYRNACEKSR